MKKIFFSFFLAAAIIFTTGCCERVSVKYDVKVVYENGDFDRFMLEAKGTNPRLYLNTKHCLIITKGNKHEAVACGVRKFEIISKRETKMMRNEKI